jgi:hypothetical protein
VTTTYDAENYPIKVRVGATYYLNLQLLDETEVTPIDLTGATFASKIKTKPGKTGVPIQTITVTPVDLTIGKISLNLTAAETTALEGHEAKNYAWDLFITYGEGTVRKEMAGPVIIAPRVTD